MADALQLAMVAGEASGDLLGAELLDALKARWPVLDAGGIGGPHMAARGFDCWWPAQALAVRGYVEVLAQLPRLLGIRRRLRRRLLDSRPELFVGIDAPDFNFSLERSLRRAGIRTVHFVSPSFWAWRSERLRVLREAADHVLCLFPFEPELLRDAGIEASFVGHPLADMMARVPAQAGARRQLALPAGAPVLALLPGSRSAEVGHLLPRFLAAAALLWQESADLQFVLPVAPAMEIRVHELVRQARLPDALQAQLHIVQGQSHLALSASDLALIASGTATLEAALLGKPMVIAYAMPAASYRIMKGKQRLPWVGLPNILCAPPEWLREDGRTAIEQPPEFVVPELIQDEATPAALAAAVQRWLEEPVAAQAVRQRFAQLRQTLRQPTGELSVQAIEGVLA